MSYAEDETDVEGTVNGVTATTTGTQTNISVIFPVWGVFFFVKRLHRG